MNAETILAAMLAMVPPADTELERYGVIAQAVAEVSGGQRDLAGMLLATIQHESHYRREVHDGRARGDAGRSWGLGQLCLGDRGTTQRGWTGRQLVGTDLVATRRAVAATGEVLLAHRERCRGDVACTLAGYIGTAKRKVAKRVATYQRVMTKLSPRAKPGS